MKWLPGCFRSSEPESSWCFFAYSLTAVMAVAFWHETAPFADPLVRVLQTVINLLPMLLVVALVVHGLHFLMLVVAGEHAGTVAVVALLLGVGFLVEGIFQALNGRLTLHDFIQGAIMPSAILVGAGLRARLAEARFRE